MKAFYITTPIYYPNARPHVGSAYTTIACDAIARYKRMCGYDVAFLTGTDEHGEKLQRAADAAGIPVKQFVAEKRELFKNLWRTLGIPEHSAEHPAGYRFVHTSDNEAHKKAVHWMIQQAKNYSLPYCARCDKYLEHGTRPAMCPTCGGSIEHRSAIFSKRYEGRYCIHDEMYVSEGAEPADCPNCGRPAELISEDNYFFRLSAFQERLLNYYADNPEFVQPDFRRNEVESFVRGGKTLVKGSLRDISISRHRLKWGIQWPGDPEQVVYVWYDALTSYLSGIGFRGDDKPEPDFEKYWMSRDATRVHMIGKDILRFHAVYWPAFLWAAGLPLPHTIFAHGWIYYQQDKMSKSKGNVVYPEPIVKALDEFGAPGNDTLRYYLLRDTPFGLDGNFSYDGLIQRYNSDLANGLGNLASRTLALIDRHFDGRVPGTSEISSPYRALWYGPDAQASRDATRARILGDYSAFQFSKAAEEIWKIVAHYGDEFLTHWAPWSKIKNPADRGFVGAILNFALEALRTMVGLAYPLVPESSRRIWDSAGCMTYLGRLEDLDVDGLRWAEFKPGTQVGKPEPIFPRLDKGKALKRLHELAEEDRATEKKTKETTVEPQPENKGSVGAPTSPSAGRLAAPAPGGVAPSATDGAAAGQKITIDDFAKVELRAGTIVSAEPIPGATKLLKLQVDIGTEVRQICAGIAEYYKREQLTNMKVVIVANLQPRKLRGVESNGMIVAASVGDEGRPVLATFAEDVPNGAKLR